MQTESKIPMGYVRVAGVVNESIVDGPGLRMTVFFQGCPHKCPGCHNPHTHELLGGRIVAVDEIMKNFNANPLLNGITLSGGEPFAQIKEACLLARSVSETGKNVVVYTGWRWEEVCEMMAHFPAVGELLKHTSLLIDGRYEEELRSLNLTFRGSSNQRIIDVQKTLANNYSIVEWNE